ncbi:MAG TPA: 6-bladed beta-propeller [Solirubrobacterales bacterium]
MKIPAAIIGALVLVLVLASPVMALFLGEWGGSGTGQGEFNSPTGVATNTLNEVYVVDSGNNRVQKFSETGEFVAQFGGPGSGPGQLSSPAGISIDEDNFLYVADQGNARVQKLGPWGEFIALIGSPGQFSVPTDVAVDPKGNVVVSDAGHNRIFRFDASGKLLNEWGSGGSATGQFSGPRGIATNAAGQVYVADTGNLRVQKFGPDGEFLTAWGSAGKGAGLFASPVGVSTDPVGKVYVPDSLNNQVQKFGPDGEFISAWGETGTKPNFFQGPVDVAVSFSAKTYVVDAGNNRIEVYGKIPDPRFGQTVNLAPVGGTIKVKPPHGKFFRRLYSATQVKVGSIVDATTGKVALTSAKDRVGTTQSANFERGQFRVLQPRKGKAITVLKLVGALSCKSGKGKAGASRRRGSRSLWGSGKGNYRSEGSYGAATVRGTIWLTKDTCAGTLFKVKRGVIVVKDFTSHRNVKVGAGKSYLAPAP